MDAIDWLLASQLPAIKNKKIRRLREEVLRNLDSEISFTTFVEQDTDASMTIETAEDIINRLPDGDFRLELIFISIGYRSTSFQQPFSATFYILAFASYSVFFVFWKK